MDYSKEAMARSRDGFDKMIDEAKGMRQRNAKLQLALEFERLCSDLRAGLSEGLQRRADETERGNYLLTQHIATLEKMLQSLGVDVPTINQSGELTQH
jgi:hypothetical protein